MEAPPGLEAVVLSKIAAPAEHARGRALEAQRPGLRLPAHGGPGSKGSATAWSVLLSAGTVCLKVYAPYKALSTVPDAEKSC